VVDAGGAERRATGIAPGSPTGARTCALGRCGAGPRSSWQEALAGQVRATLPTCAAGARRPSRPESRTFGSTFKNPEDPRAEGRTAGQLLDLAGCRGLRVGGAGFSAKHANFVENHGEATTADVVALMSEGRRRVKERFGIDLEPEVQALGPVPIPADWRSP